MTSEIFFENELAEVQELIDFLSKNKDYDDVFDLAVVCRNFAKEHSFVKLECHDEDMYLAYLEYFENFEKAIEKAEFLKKFYPNWTVVIKC